MKDDQLVKGNKLSEDIKETKRFIDKWEKSSEWHYNSITAKTGSDYFECYITVVPFKVVKALALYGLREELSKLELEYSQLQFMKHLLEPDKAQSSLISFIEYDDELLEITIGFREYYISELTYVKFYPNHFEAFCQAKSFGKFYLGFIKPNFITKQSKNTKMADKVIKCKINVKEINKSWLFEGEKGTYLNFTLLYNEVQDQNGNNGMIVQDVPTEIYKREIEDKVPKQNQTKGNILGNGKVFGSKAIPKEAIPGSNEGTKMLGDNVDPLDDLPFQISQQPQTLKAGYPRQLSWQSPRFKREVAGSSPALGA